jgi:polyisoprenoid-binding protein YceI
MKKSIITFSLALFAIAVAAQEYVSRPSESSMKIAGTSTLHDWESKVENFTAVVRMQGEVIQSAGFKAVVSSIKSGTSAMDANTYKAMKEPQHPNIEFTAGTLTYSGSSLPIKGSLTIAGVTRKVEFKGVIEKWSEESITIKASYPLKMSDYGIDPPKAMMGTIRTGDEVTISFNITLYKK